MGFEKQVFESFKLAHAVGVIGFDYDRMMDFWPTSGMADYILAKAISEPDRSFGYWEDHYCSAFGPAADDVKAYFRYWRKQVWEQRLQPDLNELIKKGKYHNFARGLMWSLPDYYDVSDFDETDAILARAAAHDLTRSQETRVRQLVLANEHARLTCFAVINPAPNKFKHAQKLLQFRRQHKDDMSFPWLDVLAIEKRYADTGLTTALTLADYPLPWQVTPLAWKFRLDPAPADGLAEEWQLLPWTEMKTWHNLRTDFAWDNPYRSETDPDLYKQARDYDGVGWYATQLRIPEALREQRTHLHFTGVADTFSLWFNGRLVCEDREGGSVGIPIGPFVDWRRERQTVVVRVEETGSPGGIHGKVYVVPGPDQAGAD
jgi:hypothetical protein